MALSYGDFCSGAEAVLPWLLCMQPISTDNLGPLVAYLVPGATVLVVVLSVAVRNGTSFAEPAGRERALWTAVLARGQGRDVTLREDLGARRVD